MIMILLAFAMACIDPIEFDTGNEPQRLVVDGMITNQSYFDRQEFPAPAERFYVALRWTSPVGNERDQVIRDARVELHSSSGEIYLYQWDEELKRYVFPEDDFSAELETFYFVRISLSSGAIYESEPEKLYPAPAISSVSQTYSTTVKEVQIGPEAEFVEQRGVNLLVDLPSHPDSQTIYYRWRVIPSWVWQSSILPEISPVKTCYITNRYFFQKIHVRADRTGGYANELFFLETDDNEKIQYDFSALILQYSLSPDAYKFWEELATQQELGGGIFDPPPFPLSTNIYRVGAPEEQVSGYFMVAHESALRWFINQTELPYSLVLSDLCESIPGFPPPEQCGNCLLYTGGGNPISNVKPDWWRDWQ